MADQPFGKDFPLRYLFHIAVLPLRLDQQLFLHFSLSVQICKDVFGESFDLNLLYQAANATNAQYGGKGIRQRRIVFINGSIDPWHALGLTNQTAEFPDNVVVYIKGNGNRRHGL